jgi:uncharacterized repeat protein (TIGR01451 family)
MAQLSRSGNRIAKGQLAGVGYRQQIVRVGANQYRKRTVAFALPDSVSNPNVPSQQRNRSKFAFIGALGSGLSQNGILRSFFRTGTGLGSFQSFIQRNIADTFNGGAMVTNPNDPGDVYVSFPNLQVARGIGPSNISVYQPETPLTPEELETNCYYRVKLAWDANAQCGAIDLAQFALYIVALGLDANGSLVSVKCVQPGIRQCEGQAELDLPITDCQKTYFYAWFVNPTTLQNTSSSYIGTQGIVDALPVFDPTCFNPSPCTLDANVIPFTPPTDFPAICPDDSDVSQVIYSGNSEFSGNSDVLAPINPLPALCSKYNVELEYTGDPATEFSVIVNQTLAVAGTDISNIQVLVDGDEQYNGPLAGLLPTFSLAGSESEIQIITTQPGECGVTTYTYDTPFSAEANIRVTKIASSPTWQSGDAPLRYTIEVANEGILDVNGVTLNDVLAPEFDTQSVSIAYVSGSTGPVTVTDALLASGVILNMPSGSSVIVEVFGTFNSPGIVPNVAFVTMPRDIINRGDGSSQVDVTVQI